MRASSTQTSAEVATAAGFVGREHELAELEAAFAMAAGGQAGSFLLFGDPGIGKTRLAQELAMHAAGQGAQVLWGRCWEDAGVPPYWPWVQILRPLLRGMDFPSLRQRRGTSLAALAQILPELHASLGGDDTIALGDVLDAAAARFSLFEIVAELLRDRTEREAMVLIFDDLHAADEVSLQLLHFVARELRDARLLLIGTYREVEVQLDANRCELINGLARSGKRLPLVGLSPKGVGELLQRHMTAAPSPSLIERVYQVTEGNPFFVDEVVRMLAARQRERPDVVLDSLALRIPHGVRETIRERLRLLSPPCRELLRVASAVGREFDTPCLSHASVLPASEVLSRLAEASGIGLVEALGETLDRYRFTHGLIRDVLYDEIPAGERPEVHRQLGLALEQQAESHRDAYVPELARHFLHALSCGEGGRAVKYAVRAAESATARMGYEDAALHYTQGLQALAQVGPSDLDRRCELLLGLGTVQRAAGSDSARATFEKAADVARELRARDEGHVHPQPRGAHRVRSGDAATRPQPLPLSASRRAAQLLARAAVGFADHGLGIPLLASDARVMTFLEQGLAGLPAADSTLRARILGRLSVETTLAYDAPRSDSLSATAVDMARRLGDATTLATTLSYRHFVLWRLDYMADRLGIVAEIIQLAEKIGHKELSLQGRSWRLVDLMSIGDWPAFDKELVVQAKGAEELRQPRYLWTTTNMRVARALWRGEWEQAEALAQDSLAIGERIGDPTTITTPVAQTFILRREQGRLAEIEPLHRLFSERYQETPTPHSTLALLYMDLDRRDESRERFEQAAADNFEQVEREYRIGILPHLAEVCAYLDDARRAARLYALLQPYAGICVPYGATASFGASGLYLGILAATLGQWETAVAHFEAALELNRRLKGLPWVARTQLAYARMLLKRGVQEPADHLKVSELLDGALAVAQALSMVRLTQQIEALRSRHGAAPKVAAKPSMGAVRETTHASFRLEGDFWIVGEAATALHIKDSKGMRYVSHLLRHAGREFHASDLALLDAPDDVGQVLGRGRGSEIPMLDAQAKREYKRRIDLLREQIAEATSFNDSERASRLDEELDLITQELSRGLGLHGRDRSAGSFAERSRLNVTRAIKSVVRRIAGENEFLGRYLQTTIRTGAFCSYTPDPRIAVEWSL